jgi:hypothetical protein
MTATQALITRVVETITGDEAWMRRATLPDVAINALLDAVIERAEAAIEAAPPADQDATADAVLDHARALLAALVSGEDGTALVGGPITPDRGSLAALWRVTADAVATGDSRS